MSVFRWFYVLTAHRLQHESGFSMKQGHSQLAMLALTDAVHAVLHCML